MKVKKCPNCGCGKFIVTAHVTQTWNVDDKGNWLETITECEEVTHKPDDDDMWTCSDCGYSGEGRVFNIA